MPARPAPSRLLMAPHPRQGAAGGRSSGRLAPMRSGSQSSRPLRTSLWPSPGYQRPWGSRKATVNKRRALLLVWSGSPLAIRDGMVPKILPLHSSAPGAPTGSQLNRVSQAPEGGGGLCSVSQVSSRLFPAQRTTLGKLCSLSEPVSSFAPNFVQVKHFG